MKSYILSSLQDSHAALTQFMDDDDKVAAIENAASMLIDVFENGNAVYSCGNGGSMSDAMHFAEELTGRYRKDRPGLPATAISDPGHISCVANDFGYEHIFSRYLQARAKPGDALLAISTSGTSANVIQAAEFANSNDMRVISLTGKPDSRLGLLADVDVHTVNYEFADKVQELHIKIIHILIEQVERHFFPENYN